MKSDTKIEKRSCSDETLEFQSVHKDNVNHLPYDSHVISTSYIYKCLFCGKLWMIDYYDDGVAYEEKREEYKG